MGGSEVKIGFLYGGQGSQQVGMGKDFYENDVTARDFYDQIPKIRELSFFASMEELSRTKNTQPCMIAFDVIVTKILKERGVQADMSAGLSIGEYAALYSAGVFTKQDVLRIAEIRGQAMEDALSDKYTMMCACIGLSQEQVCTLCERYTSAEQRVEIANRNCPGQIVIGGDTNKIKELMREVKDKRMGKAIPLRVSGAFHTSYMKPAGEILKTLFEEIQFHDMQIPVVCNLTGMEKEDEEKLSNMLVKQVQSPILFEKSIEYMIEKGVDTFIEIGFGRVLEGFVKKISQNTKVLPCYDRMTLNEVVQYIQRETEG